VKVAFDTSVIIAGTHDIHPHHRRAIVWIDAVLEQRITGLLTWHALAEIWSVLTRLPVPLRLSPEQAMRVVRRVQGSSSSTNWSRPYTTRRYSGVRIAASSRA
jgi:predicted nucleic acid-binding protein